MILSADALEGWHEIALPEDEARPWHVRFASADTLTQHRLSNGVVEVDMMIAWWDHQREGAEALHVTNRFDDDDVWIRSRLATQSVATGQSALPATARLDTLGHSRTGDAGAKFHSRKVLSWTWIGGTFVTGAVDAKLTTLRSRLLGGTPEAAVIAFSVPYDQPEERKAATAAIEALLADMPPLAQHLNGLAGR